MKKKALRKKPARKPTRKTTKRRRGRRFARKRSLAFPIALVILGTFLVGLWGVHRYFYNRSISLSDALIASYAQEATQTALPIHIQIGAKISLPVVEAGKVEGKWTVSQTSANHVRESALPGEAGNIIIYGHNLNRIFGYLPDTKIGDIVEIRTTDGTLHAYQVSKTSFVSPTQTDLLAPTATETLTLYTCVGLLDSLRFVVVATPIVP
jgi:LPXTG-site transpeptidase (sortase) family protein